MVDCYSQVVLVDWRPSDGALLYEIVATDTSGHNVTCETNSSHCGLEGLLCGRRYSVSVRAVGHTCSSVASMAEELLTGNGRHPFKILRMQFKVDVHAMQTGLLSLSSFPTILNSLLK